MRGVLTNRWWANGETGREAKSQTDRRTDGQIAGGQTDGRVDKRDAASLDLNVKVAKSPRFSFQADAAANFSSGLLRFRQPAMQRNQEPVHQQSEIIISLKIWFAPLWFGSVGQVMDPSQQLGQTSPVNSHDCWDDTVCLLVTLC